MLLVIIGQVVLFVTTENPIMCITEQPFSYSVGWKHPSGSGENVLPSPAALERDVPESSITPPKKTKVASFRPSTS